MANENSKSVRKDMRFDKELITIIDKVRGDVPFAAWVKRSAIMRLEAEGHVRTDQHLSETDNNVPVRTDTHNEEREKLDTKEVKQTTQEEREALIKQCYENGMDYKQTAEWLNNEGYKPQRGDTFTPNSVRSIKARMSKMGKL